MGKLLLTTLTILLFRSVFLSGQIINIEDKRVRLGDSIAVKGYIDCGIQAVKNDRSLLTISGTGQLEGVNRRHFFLLLSGYNLVKAGESNFLNDGFGHFRYNFDWQKHIVIEAFTQGQYNERTRSLFRGLAGTGLRFKFRFFKKQRLYIGTAYMFEHNQFKGNALRQYDHRLTNYVSINVNVQDKLKLLNTSYFQPLLNNFTQSRLSSQTTFLFKIIKNLTFRAAFSVTYDNDPRLPEAVPDLTYNLTNGVRWEF